MPDAAGVVVGVVRGADETQSRALREALVAALARRDVAAALTGDNPAIRRIEADASEEGTAIDRRRVRVTWRLLDRRGRPQKSTTAAMIVDAAVWRNPQPGALAGLVEDAAEQFTASIVAGADGRTVAPQKQVRLFLWPVAGPSARQNGLLLASLQRALQEAGIPVVDRIDDAQLIVSGEILLGEARNGTRPLEIHWTMLKPDGGEVGVLRQRNRIADAEVEGGWATLSLTVATAAAESMAETIRGLPGEALQQAR